MCVADPEQPTLPPQAPGDSSNNVLHPPAALHGIVMPSTARYSNAKGGRKSRLNKRRIYTNDNSAYGYNTFNNDRMEIADVKDASSVKPPYLVQICSAILSNTAVRGNLYLIGGLAFSLLGVYLADYQEYFYTARPKNILNEYFVKFGWGWTLGIVLPFSVMCGAAFDGWKGILSAGFRCAVATGVWFGFTTLFNVIRKTLNTDFDISGHAFILIWSNMFLVEEAKAYIGWEAVIAAAQGAPTSRPLLKWFLWPTRLLLVTLSLLSVLWDVMYFSTVLFFHTWDEKVVAIALALFAWWLIYRGLYGTMPFLPDLPSRQATIELLKIEQERRGGRRNEQGRGDHMWNNNK
jgi:hypothetical protein